MHEFRNIEELIGTKPGLHLGDSAWLTIEQDMINTFADATGDHQWIHVDEERAASGPFGSTIAHGFLTLALLPQMIRDIYRLQGVRMGVNYGLDRVRFITPVKVGSRIRAITSFAAAEKRHEAVRLWLDSTVEIDASPKPACIARTVTQLYV